MVQYGLVVPGYDHRATMLQAIVRLQAAARFDGCLLHRYLYHCGESRDEIST